MDKDTGRVEAFSDGVFAFALTLLVLDLKAPDASLDLAGDLLVLWPSYLAFALTFLGVVVMWLNHHGIFRRIQRADGPLLMANVALLFFIVLAPFVTAVLSANVDHAGGRLAAALSAAYFLTVTLLFRLLWATATRPGAHLVEGVTEGERRDRAARNLAGAGAYAAALLLALWSAWATIGLCYLTVAYFLAVGIRRNRAR